MSVCIFKVENMGFVTAKRSIDMLSSIAMDLKRAWSGYAMTPQAPELLQECEQLGDAHLIVELLEDHPDLIGAFFEVNSLGRVQFGLRFSHQLRFELMLKLQELWKEQPSLAMFQSWSPFILDTSWFEGIQHLDVDRLSSSHVRSIAAWCAHFGTQEVRVIPKGFFRALPVRTKSSGSAAQPVVLSHQFVIQKYPITQGMYAFWKGDCSVKSPAKPQVFEQVLDVLRLCNLMSRVQGRQQVYGPSEVLRQQSNMTSLSRLDGSAGEHGSMELEELMDSITINHQADGWRIPSEVEWECAAKAQIKSTDLCDSHPELSSLYFDYVGGDELFDVGCMLKNEKGDFLPDAVGQKRLNGRGLSDMSGAIPELCWGEGFPIYFEEMIHPICALKDPFLYGTDEEERLLTGVWSTRGGPFKTLSDALRSRPKKYAVRLVRTVHKPTSYGA